MRYSIRKTGSHISITYISGDWSNNLSARNFEIEKKGDNLALHIDLSSNLKVRNKSANCHSDAQDLIDHHNELKSLQISEEQVMEGMLKANNSVPAPSWRLVLHLGRDSSFEYSIVPEGSKHSLVLNVADV